MSTKPLTFFTSILLLIFLSSCTTSPIAPTSATELSPSIDSSSPSVLTGSFSSCERWTEWDDYLIIRLDPGTVFGLIQIRNHPAMPWFDTWEFNTGIVSEWDYDNEELRVYDPKNFLVSGSYSYRILQFK
jgi:hypothetical protein